MIIELPKSYPVYFERKKYLSIFLLLVILISGYITYYSFKEYTVYHIYSAFVFTISLFYLSWLSFNPFCLIQDEYFEINDHWFSNKKYMYRDIQKVETNDKKNKIILFFNDHDTFEISIKQLNSKNREILIELIKIHVYRDLLSRD